MGKLRTKKITGGTPRRSTSTPTTPADKRERKAAERAANAAQREARRAERNPKGLTVRERGERNRARLAAQQQPAPIPPPKSSSVADRLPNRIDQRPARRPLQAKLVAAADPEPEPVRLTGRIVQQRFDHLIVEATNEKGRTEGFYLSSNDGEDLKVGDSIEFLAISQGGRPYRAATEIKIISIAKPASSVKKPVTEPISDPAPRDSLEAAIRAYDNARGKGDPLGAAYQAAYEFGISSGCTHATACEEAKKAYGILREKTTPKKAAA